MAHQLQRGTVVVAEILACIITVHALLLARKTYVDPLSSPIIHQELFPAISPLSLSIPCAGNITSSLSGAIRVQSMPF